MISNFLETAYLPQGQVTVCAIGPNLKKLKNALEQLGKAVLEIPADDRLPVPIRHHIDLLLHHAGEGEIWLSHHHNDITAKLTSLGFKTHTLSQPCGPEYPADIALCVLPLHKIVFGNLKYNDRTLLNYYQSLGFSLLDTAQGYTKCTCCIVNSNSIITSDSGLAKLLEKYGVDVLLIQPGFVQLPGYNYGFIGGCSGLLAKNCLAFYGDIDSHPDVEKINAFCSKKGIEIICLCPDEPLTDIGGITPLLEQVMP